MASALVLQRTVPSLRLALLRSGVRAASTTALNHDEGLRLLNEQRNKRPTSPHFTIYQPQMTWIPSIMNRVTGTGLSVGLYAFSVAYLAAPVIGMPFDGAAVISLVSSLPVWFKVTAKALIGGSFWFHTFNGMRHLMWDTGFVLDLKKSYAAGYTVLAATGLATIATLFI